MPALNTSTYALPAWVAPAADQLHAASDDMTAAAAYLDYSHSYARSCLVHEVLPGGTSMPSFLPVHGSQVCPDSAECFLRCGCGELAGGLGTRAVASHRLSTPSQSCILGWDDSWNNGGSTRSVTWPALGSMPGSDVARERVSELILITISTGMNCICPTHHRRLVEMTQLVPHFAQVLLHPKLSTAQCTLQISTYSSVCRPYYTDQVTQLRLSTSISIKFNRVVRTALLSPAGITMPHLLATLVDATCRLGTRLIWMA